MSIVEDVGGVPPTPRFEEISVTGHCWQQWQDRSDQPTLNPSIAWLEAIPIDYPSAKPPANRARYHEVTELILLAEPNGDLVTCIRLEDRPRNEQRYIRDQLEVSD